jgi:hypothetical protein
MTQQNQNQSTLEEYEEKAQEMVWMTFALCEQQMAERAKFAIEPQKALTAAALCVRQSLHTFMAVTKLPKEI